MLVIFVDDCRILKISSDWAVAEVPYYRLNEESNQEKELSDSQN